MEWSCILKERGREKREINSSDQSTWISVSCLPCFDLRDNLSPISEENQQLPDSRSLEFFTCARVMFSTLPLSLSLSRGLAMFNQAKANVEGKKRGNSRLWREGERRWWCNRCLYFSPFPLRLTGRISLGASAVIITHSFSQPFICFAANEGKRNGDERQKWPCVSGRRETIEKYQKWRD